MEGCMEPGCIYIPQTLSDRKVHKYKVHSTSVIVQYPDRPNELLLREQGQFTCKRCGFVDSNPSVIKVSLYFIVL